MNESPDVLEQVPAGGGVNKPASGTYGEKTELANLQAQLPAAEAVSAPEQPQQTPAVPGGRPVGSGTAPGLPAGLLRPTARPEVPVSTPLSSGPVNPLAGAVDARQRRLLLLDQLSQHPDASPEVREWATVVKEKLIARG